jgi:chromosome segregation ATPase
MTKDEIQNKLNILKFQWSELQNEIENFDMSKFTLNKDLLNLISKQNEIKSEIYDLEDTINNG